MFALEEINSGHKELVQVRRFSLWQMILLDWLFTCTSNWRDKATLNSIITSLTTFLSNQALILQLGLHLSICYPLSNANLAFQLDVQVPILHLK
eukprot:c22442_g1_i1 orf=170-451(+)